MATIINRFNKNINGAITFIGNTLGLSKAAGSLSPGIQGSIGAFITMDNRLRAPSGWGPNTTLDYNLNSSPGNLIIPVESEIVYAELLWAGTSRIGNNSISPSGYVTFIDSLNIPHTVRADEKTMINHSFISGIHRTESQSISGEMYIRSSIITDIIKKSGNGQYVCSGVNSVLEAANDSMQFAGWSLMVVYTNPKFPLRNIRVWISDYDSLENEQTLEIVTPKAGSVKGKIAFVAAEGDAIYNDNNFIKVGKDKINLSGPNNPENNFFSSQINDDFGNLSKVGPYGDRNHNPFTLSNISGGRQGWDITNIILDNTIKCGSSNLVLGSENSKGVFKEQIFILGIGFQVDLNEPDIFVEKAVDKAYGNLGEILTYSFNIKNNGVYDIENIKFSSIISEDTTFVENSVIVHEEVKEGLNPDNINVGILESDKELIITYKVKIDRIPKGKNITTRETLKYEFATSNSDEKFTRSVNVPTISKRASFMPMSMNTKLMSTSVNVVDLTTTVKSVERQFVNSNDELTYTIAIQNTGNVAANTMKYIETIPSRISFKTGSVTINGISYPSYNPNPPGFTISSPLQPNGATTVTFKILTTTNVNAATISGTSTLIYNYTADPSLPNAAVGSIETNSISYKINDYLISNNAFIAYNFIVDPSVVDIRSDSNTTSNVNTQLNRVLMSSDKVADKSYAKVGDTINYTITLANKGNVSANNVVLIDTIPNGVTFVTNSLVLNGVTQTGANFNSSYLAGTVPVGTTILTYKAVVSTIPSINPIANAVCVTYNYTVDPLIANGYSGGSNSSIFNTQINNIFLNTKKYVDKVYADKGDTLNYTIVFENTGNITANSVTFKDTIPNNTTFITNSLVLNGITQTGLNPNSGISLGTLPIGSSTLTFKISIDTIPTPNPIVNSAVTTYSYTVDPSVPNGYSSSANTNIVSTNVNNVTLYPSKSASKNYAGIGEEVVYTFQINSFGNTSANEVVLVDTIPDGTSFIDNSVQLNGVLKYGENPSLGANLGNLPSGISTLTFRVLVQTLPSLNPSKNSAVINYKYTVDPNSYNGTIKSIATNVVATTINAPIINVSNKVSTIFANIGTTITYTIEIYNSGNTSASNVVVTNTIPEGAGFLANSLAVNGVTKSGYDLSSGYNIGTVPVGTTTVTFEVVTNTLPNVNPMPSFASIYYKYTADPSLPNGINRNITTNTVNTKVTTSILNANKIVSKKYAKVGDTLDYTIQLYNIGNTTSNEVYLQDTIPNGTSIVTDSVTYNGVTLPGINIADGIHLGTIPLGNATLTFSVVVNTIPSINPTPNSCSANYKYTVDPSLPNGVSKDIISNIVTTQINTVYLSGSKNVNTNYADIGDTLIYTINLSNTGSITADNLYIQNTLPNGTQFVTDSLVVNGVTHSGGSTELGLFIGSIALGISTITYNLLVNTVPSPNPIISDGGAGYSYVIDPENGIKLYDSININNISTNINYLILDSNKIVDKKYADVGDILTYTISLSNRGNVTANNIIFKDTIPNGTSFVANSFSVDGAIQSGVNLNIGVTIPSISSAVVSTISYQVVVNTIPSSNPINTQSITSYNYTVDPSIPNGRSGVSASNIVSTKINRVFLNSSNSVSKRYAKDGDTLTYTVVLSNTGNIRANNVVLTDTVVDGLSFVNNSVVVQNSGYPINNSTSASYLFTVDPSIPNAVSNTNVSNSVSTILNTSYDATIVAGMLNVRLDIIPVGITTVTFAMLINTIPSPNPIVSTVVTSYQYTVDPSIPNSVSNYSITNGATTTMNIVFVDFNKNVDKNYAKVGDTLIYTIPINNKGNISINNAIIMDTIPNNTTFITNTLSINGITQNGISINPTLSLGTLPVGITTVSFKVRVDTIPSINPILTSSSLRYQYTVDPSIPNQYSVFKTSDIISTKVNDVFMNSTKSVDKAYGDINEILTYTMLLANTGNTIASNVVISDTVPIGSSFIPGSVKVMNEYDPINNEIVAAFSYTVNPDLLITANTEQISSKAKTLYDNIDGNVINGILNINVGTIPIGTTTISFNMVVNTIPTPNPMLNSAVTSYSYTVDPSIPSGESRFTNTNIVSTQINTVFLNSNKHVNMNYANVGDKLVYTIPLINTGSVSANNVVVKDTIPQGTSFVTNSLTVNGVTQTGINPQLGLTIPTVAIGVTTVAFSVKVDTIPTINPISNLSYASYQYTAYPTLPNSKGSVINTNVVNTQINTVFLNSKKYVDKGYADVGDTILYTIEMYNTGNITADNVLFTDTIPQGTSFETDTLVFNGVTQTGANPLLGFNAGSISVGTSTISFMVLVNTIPTSNPMQNNALINYNYTVDPSIPNQYSSYSNTNSVNTKVNSVFLNASNKVSKVFTIVGDTLTYKIVLNNSGNVVANNVVLQDTIISGTSFVNNSVKVNTVTVVGANPNSGFTIGTVPVGITTITFDILVNTIPSLNPIINQVQFNYKYTVDPSIPMGRSAYGNTNIQLTDISERVVNNVKLVDKDYINVGEILTYTINLINNSQVIATNCIFKDTIPYNTTYIGNSLYINGINNVGLTPNIPITLGTIPQGTTSVSFMVRVDTIPSVNKVVNSSVITYNYTETPEVLNGASASMVSNIVSTNVNTVFLNSTKTVDKKYADIGDILTYRMLLVNTGNTIANNLVLKDTIPDGTSFILGSVLSTTGDNNGNVINGALNINITTIPIGTTTISFQVSVDTLPAINPVLNSAISNYSYTVNPAVPNEYSSYSSTNVVGTKINTVFLNSGKYSDKKYANVGDTILYTIPIVNSGNITANNLRFQDTIPVGTTFKTNSILVNGITQTGANPIVGFQVQTIPVGITTITFGVVVDTIPSINPIENFASMSYYYTVDPSIPNSRSSNIKTNLIDTQVNTVFLNSRKIVDRGYSDVGETILYTIEVYNTGNIEANNLLLIETIPNGLSYVDTSMQLVINSVNTQLTSVNYNNVTNVLNAIVATVPVGTTTITFNALVNTIPSTNPAINKASIAYAYTVDPSVPNNNSSIINTTAVNTKINTVFLNATQSTDKNYADIGDTLTYIISLINTGNTTANNVILTDTIPLGTTFVPNSLMINNVQQIGETLVGQFNIDYLPIGTTTIAFKVIVDTIPSINPVENSMLVSYQYTVDPSVPNAYSGFANTNIVSTQINSVLLNSNKYVDKGYATIGDTLIYTIPIVNTGNVTANNVVMLDTISNGMTFVVDSVRVNDNLYLGVSPNTGVNLGTLPIGTTTVSFEVKVNTIPNINPVINSAIIGYNYTVDPSIPNNHSAYIKTSEAQTNIKAVFLNSTKISNKSYANVGDKITYTIKLVNTGNITARNVLITDTIPESASFASGSLNVQTTGNYVSNSVQAAYSFDIDQTQGISGNGFNVSNSVINNYGLGQTITVVNNIFSLELEVVPVGITTVTFDVNVDTIPSINPMLNSAYTTFNYTVDPKYTNSYNGEINTNIVSTKVNTVFLNSNEYVDKDYAHVGDTLVYTIPIVNTGNVSANNAIFQSTTPQGTSFVTNSFVINGVTISGGNPNISYTIGTIPVGITTVTFAIRVDTIPSVDPIPSASVIRYQYTVDPSLPNASSNSANTNITNTKVNTVFLNSKKYVNRQYSDIGEEIVYTMLLANTGNTIANNVILRDTIPNEVSYKQNSLQVIYSATVSLPNNPIGNMVSDVFTVEVGTIPIGITTVNFTVRVDTIPSANPIYNEAITDFKYTVNPNAPNNYSETIRSNIVNTKVNTVFLNSTKTVDKNYAHVGDTLLFTIPIINTGNITANQCVIQDTIPNNTTFVSNSLKVNGVTIVGGNPQNGYSLGTVPVGVTTLSFNVVVNTIPSPNPIPNFATTTFKYTVDPSTPNNKSGVINTNITNTKVNTVFLNSSKKVDRNYSDVGETILYTIELYNTGNITANNVQILESIPSGLSYISSSLEAFGEDLIGTDAIVTSLVNVQYNSSNGLLKLDVVTVPVGTTTMTFRALVNTIPSVNPAINTVLIGYDYTVNPSIPNGYTNTSKTNSVSTKVNAIFLNMNKSASKKYAKVGDTVIYTIPINNSGNTTANNAMFLDTIPMGTSFINNSFTVNGTTKLGVNLQGPISLGTLPIGTTTIVFKVNIDTIPSINPIENEVFVDYKYTVFPTLPNSYENQVKTNLVDTKINTVFINSSKYVDKKYLDIGDTIVYTIPIVNTGNTEANNAIFLDTITNGMSFVVDSLTVNDIPYLGANPNLGVTLNTIPVGTTTIAFSVKVDTLPTGNPINNVALTSYKYTVDPSVPNEYSGYTKTNITETNVKSVLLNSYKKVNKSYANVGDTLSYSIILDNGGNTNANFLIIKDTIVNGLVFLYDSVTVLNSGYKLDNNPSTILRTIADVTVVAEEATFALDVIPVGITTINFNVLVDTIPSIDTILNSVITSYSYTVDPSLPNAVYNEINSNVVSTKISTVFLNSRKYVDKVYANIGDTILYTVPLINSGNTTANNVIFQDTIPEGTSFINNSLTVNGLTKTGVNPNVGFSVGTVPVGTTTVSFMIKVETIPSLNPIPNSATTIYDYTVDPSIPNAYSNKAYTNIVTTKVNTVFLNTNKFVDKAYVDIGDVILYTIPIKNTGNVNANNAIFQDTIPEGTSFVVDSLAVDGVNEIGINPTIEFTIGTIPVGTMTLSFKVLVETIPTVNPMLNAAVVKYDYTVDPSIPNGYSNSANTNIVSTRVNTVFLNMNKHVDKKYANVGDTLIYTIPIANTGNMPANNCILQDDIPGGTTFVTNSLKVNDVTLTGVAPNDGHDIGSIAVGITTVTFKVVVNTIPTQNPIENMALVTYKYTVSPTIPNEKNGFIKTNVVDTKINTVFLNSQKAVDKKYANVGDTISYTVPIKNTGNITADNAILRETIPKGVLYITGSLGVLKGDSLANISNTAQCTVNYDINTGALDVYLQTIPVGTTTVTFNVLADTIPTLNPVFEKALIYYNYTVDPSIPNEYSSVANTNIVDTKVTTVFLNTNKMVSQKYANIGDTLIYTIPIINTGNTTANNVIMKDTIPTGTSFVNNSLIFNSITQTGANLQSGLIIGTLPIGVSTVSYKVKVDTIPTPNPMLNAASITYDYTVDPSIPNEYSSSANSNISSTRVNTVLLNTKKRVSTKFINIPNKITYTIVMDNTGSTYAANVVVQDTIAEGISFVDNSLRVNDIVYPGATIQNGFNLGTVPIGLTTITFDVFIDTVPSPNPIENLAFTSYKYTVDPSIPNQYEGDIKTNTVVTRVTAAVVNSEKSVDNYYADVGDTLTYTILLDNNGNTAVSDVLLIDTIPDNVTLVQDSVQINGTIVPGANPSVGIDIGTIPVGSITVSFSVAVDTIPNVNPIPNIASTKYKYTIDPSLPNEKDGGTNTNYVNTEVRTVFLNSIKSINKDYAKVGETFEYTVQLINTGNVSASNAVLIDTIPNGLSFVTNSLKVNGLTTPSANPSIGFELGTVPVGITTLSYLVKVDTIPTPNPVYSAAVTKYDYTVNPGTPFDKSSSTNTNIVSIKINEVFLNSKKYVNRQYSDIGEEITYTMILVNTGNTIANNVVLRDTIPKEVSYKQSSLEVIYNTTESVPNIATGNVVNNVFTVDVGTIPIGTTTLSFTVSVDTIPSINPILNEAVTDFKYTVNPNEPNGYSGKIRTNIVATKVNTVLLNSTKKVDKAYAHVGDTLIFTVPIVNTGNVTANQCIFQDPIPNDTTFVNNSLKVNGITIAGANPENGYLLGTIPVGTTTVSFNVIVNTIPSPDPIQNSAVTTFKYTVDPSIPNDKNGFIKTNITSTKINTVFLNSSKKVDRNYSDVGETVLYTVELYNTGNISANNVQIIESIPNGLSYIDSSLQAFGQDLKGSNPVVTSSVSVQYNNNTKLLRLDVATIPVGTTTMTFRAFVDTIPNLNPAINTTLIGYQYTVNPSIPNGYSNTSRTNSVSTMVSTVFLNINKSTSKKYAKVGDTVIYTIPIKNSGNTTTNNTLFLDTIPVGTSFITDSFMVNGSVRAGVNLNGAVNLGTLPVGTTTIVFKINIDTIPSIDPIKNEAFVSYKYTVFPTLPNSYSGEVKTNIVNTKINTVFINSSKSVDKKYLDIGDTIVYTIPIINTGNISANNAIFLDTISNGMSFINNSLTINGEVYLGANPNVGVTLATIPIGTTTIAFSVKVDTLPTGNPVSNIAIASYKYTVDPSIPNEYSDYTITNSTGVNVKSVLLNSYNRVDKRYANVGDTLSYTIILDNGGNITANEVLIKDTIANGIAMLFDTFTVVNGGYRLDSNPNTTLRTIATVTVVSGISRLSLDVVPVGITTISFKVLVSTIPSIDPVLSCGITSFKYTVDPSLQNAVNKEINTNLVSTKVNTVFLNSKQFVDKDYADIGYTLIYSIPIINTGNVVANNAILQSTIPQGTSFVTNSLVVNGTTIVGGSPNIAYTLGTLQIGITTVTFAVKVDTIPNINPIQNAAVIKYKYTVDPSLPNAISSSANTNISNVKVNTVFLNSIKKVDKAYANQGDTISYSIDLINTGNVTANNVLLQDTVPDGTLFADDSVAINGVVKPGINPTGGIYLGTIPVGTTSVSFNIKVSGIPRLNPVENVATIGYQYTVDPSIPNQNSRGIASNIVSTMVHYADLTGAYKIVDKPYATCNDIVTYKIFVPNKGNIEAKNLILADSIPIGTTYIPNTLKVNGIIIPGDPGNINIGTINPGAISIVEFKVKVNCILNN